MGTSGSSGVAGAQDGLPWPRGATSLLPTAAITANRSGQTTGLVSIMSMPALT